MNALDELTAYLRDRADAADLGHTPLGVITRGGLRRRHRRRAVATASVLAAGAVTAVASAQLLGTGDGKRVSTDPVAPDPTNASTTAPSPTGAPTPPVAPDTGQPAALVESPLVWNEITVGSAESIALLDEHANWTNTMRSVDGTLYQPATTPGRQRYELTPMLYRSDDGVSWRAAPEQMFEGRVAPSAVQGDRLYAISTTPAGAAGAPDDGTLYAATSLDGGADWSTIALPYDLATVRATPGVQEATIRHTQVAANERGVVIAATVSAGVTPDSVGERLGVDPASVQIDSATGFIVQRETSDIQCAELQRLQMEASEAYAGDGEDVRPGTATADGRCVLWGAEVGRYSWADLGFTGDVERARQGALLLFHSVDGSTFTRLEIPDSGPVSDVSVTASEGGFLLATSAPPIDAEAPPAITAYVSPDGTSWTPLPELPTAGCGIRGVAYVGDLPVVTLQHCDSTPAFAVLRGGAWVASTIPAAANGSTSSNWHIAEVGPRGIAVASQFGVEQQPTEDGVCCDAPDVSASHWVVSYSADGTTWSQIDLNDLVGDTSTKQVTAVRVTDSSVVVSMRTRIDLIGADDPLPDVTVLVGTPR